MLAVDSLTPPDGTDIPAARLLRNPDRFPRGRVCMIRNGRADVPAAESDYAPHAVFANPTMFGRFLCRVARQVEDVRPTHRIASMPSPG